MVFVWAYVGFHTGSFALGSFALLQIVISVPMATFSHLVVLSLTFPRLL